MGDLSNAPLTRFITNFVRTGLPSNIQLRSKIATARPHSVEEYFSLLYNKGIVGEHARSSYVIGRRFSLRIGTRGLLARLVQSAEIERYLVANWDSSGVGTGMRKFAAGGRTARGKMEMHSAPPRASEGSEWPFVNCKIRRSSEKSARAFCGRPCLS